MITIAEQLIQGHFEQQSILDEARARLLEMAHKAEAAAVKQVETDNDLMDKFGEIGTSTMFYLMTDNSVVMWNESEHELACMTRETLVINYGTGVACLLWPSEY